MSESTDTEKTTTKRERSDAASDDANLVEQKGRDFDDFDDDEDGEEDEERAARDDDGDGDGDGKRKRRRRRRRKGSANGYEPQDEQSQKVFDFLTEVVTLMNMNCKVHIKRPVDDEDRDIRLEIAGPDAGRIIGKKGQVLSALQFLSNRVLNRPGEERRYVTVDAEGYRSRRDNSLASMAKRLGKQAVNDGKIITFEPMSPRDRRVVHLALAKFEGVITKSEGEGEDRRVQIIPVRKS